MQGNRSQSDDACVFCRKIVLVWTNEPADALQSRRDEKNLGPHWTLLHHGSAESFAEDVEPKCKLISFQPLASRSSTTLQPCSKFILVTISRGALKLSLLLDRLAELVRRFSMSDRFVDTRQLLNNLGVLAGHENPVFHVRSSCTCCRGSEVASQPSNASH
jgi:hypothetical protein